MIDAFRSCLGLRWARVRSKYSDEGVESGGVECGVQRVMFRIRISANGSRSKPEENSTLAKFSVFSCSFFFGAFFGDNVCVAKSGRSLIWPG